MTRRAIPAMRSGTNGPESNIVWSYPHVTVPRHMRDIVVTEYGDTLRRLERFEEATPAYDRAISLFDEPQGEQWIVYFARGIYGDETEGSAMWAFALGIAGLAVALLSPVLGAIADRSGRRKPWLAAFVAVTVVLTALLWYAEPVRADVFYTLALVVVAGITFDLGNVFYNAMLPTVAPKHMIGRVSGWGWGLGYIGGLACLVVALIGFVQPEQPWFGVSTENAGNIRATAILVAVWFAVFALPLFLFAPDQPWTGVPLGTAVRRGLAQLWQTIREVRRYRQVVRFLIASAIYRDGLATLFAVGGLYAAGTFGMSFEQILIFAIGLNVTAGLGAAGFAWIDDWLGSKRTILLALGGLVGFGLPLLLISDITVFIVLALGLGIFVGPAQAAGRSMMARLSPPDMETQMFGLYALTGKAAAIAGPPLFGLTTALFDSQRAGMATIILFFVAGGALLGFVEPCLEVFDATAALLDARAQFTDGFVPVAHAVLQLADRFLHQNQVRFVTNQVSQGECVVVNVDGDDPQITGTRFRPFLRSGMHHPPDPRLRRIDIQCQQNEPEQKSQPEWTFLAQRSHKADQQRAQPPDPDRKNRHASQGIRASGINDG